MVSSQRRVTWLGCTIKFLYERYERTVSRAHKTARHSRSGAELLCFGGTKERDRFQTIQRSPSTVVLEKEQSVLYTDSSVCTEYVDPSRGRAMTAGEGIASISF